MYNVGKMKKIKATQAAIAIGNVIKYDQIHHTIIIFSVREHGAQEL